MAVVEGKTRKNWRRFLPLGILAAGFLAFFALGLNDYVSFEALRAHRDALRAFVDAHVVAAAAIFMLVYALAVAFSLPAASLLTLIGGFLFGVVAGTAMAVVAATLGACAVFLAARTALEDVLRRRAGPWLRKFEAGFQHDAFNYMLVLRLVPLFPFWLVNLAPALLGVRLRSYALATLIGIIPGTFVYASVGNGLGAILEAGETPDLSVVARPEIILPILGLALLSLIPVVYRRVAGRSGKSVKILKESEAEERHG